MGARSGASVTILNFTFVTFVDSRLLICLSCSA